MFHLQPWAPDQAQYCSWDLTAFEQKEMVQTFSFEVHQPFDITGWCSTLWSAGLLRRKLIFVLYLPSGLFLADFDILDLSVSPASQDDVEFSLSPFTEVLASLIWSANVINFIYIPVSWSLFRHFVSRKMKIFSLEPGLGLTSARHCLMYPFTVKNDNYTLNTFPATLVPALIAHRVPVVGL